MVTVLRLRWFQPRDQDGDRTRIEQIGTSAGFMAMLQGGVGTQTPDFLTDRLNVNLCVARVAANN
jgi:hypothetical protein